MTSRTNQAHKKEETIKQFKDILYKTIAYTSKTRNERITKNVLFNEYRQK